MTKQGYTFSDARNAIDALSVYEARTVDANQYEIIAVFEGWQRDVVGFQVRVKDMDGFAIGYVWPPQTYD